MDKTLVNSLLRIVQTDTEQFPLSKTLRAFVGEFHIGWVKGTTARFDTVAKARIRDLLRAGDIDPATPPDAWQGRTRAESLALGPNEKWTDGPAKRHRVALKALPGQPLYVGTQPLHLPPGSHLDVDGSTVAVTMQHTTVLLVENWECFNRIDALTLDLSRAGSNPLVVWRGDRLDTRTDAALALLHALARPVWALVDFDPAGLLIAAKLPHLAGVLAPEPQRLITLLQRGLEDRYRRQLPAATQVLDGCRHPDIVALWGLIRRAGRALPQEMLIDSDV